MDATLSVGIFSKSIECDRIKGLSMFIYESVKYHGCDFQGGAKRITSFLPYKTSEISSVLQNVVAIHKETCGFSLSVAHPLLCGKEPVFKTCMFPSPCQEKYDW